MVSSPKKVSPSSCCLKPSSVRASSSKRRPCTPHPSGGKGFDFASPDSSCRGTPNSRTSNKAFDFANVDTDYQAPGGCMGISMAHVMNTIRSGAASLPSSLPTSPLSIADDDDNSIFYRFHKFRSTVQKKLNCATKRQGTCDSDGGIDERIVSFDNLSLETREKSLMQRAASYATQETEAIGVSSSTDSNHVQFHYPPITSVRLRPRTRSDEIEQLFFAPEELDEIEDDRSDTKAADDIETLAVGEADDLNGAILSVPASMSSMISESHDDLDSAHNNDQAMGVTSQSRRRNSGNGERRFIRGVQIMLREKSTG